MKPTIYKLIVYSKFGGAASQYLYPTFKPVDKRLEALEKNGQLYEELLRVKVAIQDKISPNFSHFR